MAEKVKVSREVMEEIRKTIEWAKQNVTNKEKKDEDAILNFALVLLMDGDTFKGFNTFQVAKILNGEFEITQTPYEKALAYYSSFDNTPLGEATERGVIRKFLDLAEIKIQGIND